MFAGPDDYISVSSVELTFHPATATEPHCEDIQIRNEEILENEERFSIFLTSSDSAIDISPSTATVTIQNDDSKLLSKLVQILAT